MKLSILICSLTNRTDFLKRLMDCLELQRTPEVEILISTDDGTMSIGAKRNNLIEQSSGLYIAFIDDDDMVSINYIDLILKAIQTNPDVVGMHLLMTQDGENEERTYHSLKYRTWYNEADPVRPGKLRYFRNPNHLNPVKRELAIQIKFPLIDYGEDRVYSTNLLPLLKTEVYIKQPIYYYLCRSK